MKVFRYILLFTVFFNCKDILSQQKIDSIHVYYLPLSYRSHQPISDPERIKIFPIAKSFSIYDSSILLLIETALVNLKKADIKFETLDIRVVCEVFRKKKCQKVLLNRLKYIYYKNEQYYPSEKLLNLINPAGDL